MEAALVKGGRETVELPVGREGVKVCAAAAMKEPSGPDGGGVGRDGGDGGAVGSAATATVDAMGGAGRAGRCGAAINGRSGIEREEDAGEAEACVALSGADEDEEDEGLV